MRALRVHFRRAAVASLCFLVIAALLLQDFDGRVTSARCVLPPSPPAPPTVGRNHELDPPRDADNVTAEIARLRTERDRLIAELDRIRNRPELKAVNNEARAAGGTVAMWETGGQLRVEQLLTGSADYQLKNEYELVPYSRFTLNRIYAAEPGLGRRVVEKPFGYKKKDLLQVVQFAIEKLQYSATETTKEQSPSGNDSLSSQYSEADLIEGIYRTVPGLGSHYELFFRDPGSSSGNATLTHYHKVVVVRPHGSLAVSKVKVIEARSQLISVIVPLSAERLDKLDSFLNRFAKLQTVDRHVQLTIAFSGRRGLNELNAALRRYSTAPGNAPRPLPRVVFAPSASHVTFSRGSTLHAAIAEQQRDVIGDPLLFFCDVDLVVTADFFERCRQNTARGRRVYYPILFSLFNQRYSDLNPQPSVAAAGTDADSEDDVEAVSSPPAEHRKGIIISAETGFWRDFGYGMTCQYRSDYQRVGGFDRRLGGWGLEDSDLYRKHVRSRLAVVRAPDPAIIHPWHRKQCDVTLLTSEQYRDCTRSRAVGEASHAQLGMAVLGDLERQRFKGQPRL